MNPHYSIKIPKVEIIQNTKIWIMKIQIYLKTVEYHKTGFTLSL